MNFIGSVHRKSLDDNYHLNNMILHLRNPQLFDQTDLLALIFV